MRHFILPLLIATALPAAPVPVPVTEPGLPDPPQQRKPWTPPKSGVPEAFVTAAAKMFEHGLADPRGCEYREVTLTIIDRWNADNKPQKTHAWVLPATAGGWRHAVCWDVLVYPVAEVGPSADLAADIRAAVKRHIDARAPRDPRDTNMYVETDREKRSSLCHDRWLADTAVALLLRLGEGVGAKELWDQSRPTKKPAVDDSYITLAREWSWKHFERGLFAHMQGDDRLARASLRKLSEALPSIEIEAQRRGWPGRLAEFLHQLPELLDDQDRRAAAPSRKPVVCIGPGRHPDAAKRVAALIDRLDEASARQGIRYFLGGGEWSRDPVVRGLADEGDASFRPRNPMPAGRIWP
jgi:hypothetical protein